MSHLAICTMPIHCTVHMLLIICGAPKLLGVNALVAVLIYMAEQKGLNQG